MILIQNIKNKTFRKAIGIEFARLRRERKQEIEKVKKMISDYESLKTVIAPTSEEYERQMNILLDRLGNLLKMKD